MNDYIITTDACGRHYISHGYEWKSHKYILRIGKGAKALYFYTQKEIQDYLNKHGKSENQNASKELDRPESRKRNVTGAAAPIQKTEKVSSTPVGNAQQPTVQPHRPTSRKRNVTGTAAPIRRGKKVTGTVVNTGNGTAELRTAVNKSGSPRREVVYKNGKFYTVVRSKDNTVVDFANNKDATLLGTKKARSDYQRAKNDVRLLNNSLRKLKHEPDSETTAANIALTEKALKRAEQHLEKAKSDYDRSRTIDDIPDYIYTLGFDAINNILKKRR